MKQESFEHHRPQNHHHCYYNRCYHQSCCLILHLHHPIQLPSCHRYYADFILLPIRHHHQYRAFETKWSASASTNNLHLSKSYQFHLFGSPQALISVASDASTTPSCAVYYYFQSTWHKYARVNWWRALQQSLLFILLCPINSYVW